MTQPCDCCEGPRVLTPATTGNRPGLSKLAHRVGTHATFFETMQARLSSPDYPALRALKTRERSDPAIALLDAWATVADVLTFYQERIANEGYLRTATERRSVLELARLVGYALRPGVAASVYLAYTLDKGAAPTNIPKGAQASSVPAPGEQMQTFETSEPLDARVEWNAIKPRLTRPQVFENPEAIDANIKQLEKSGLYLKGIATKLKANDPLIVKFSATGKPVLVYVKSVTADSTNDRTHVKLVKPIAPQVGLAAVGETVARFSRVEDFNVSPDAAMTNRILGLMGNVSDAAAEGPDRLAAELDNTLQQLAAAATEARDRRYANLQPWIEAFHAELTAARDRLLAEQAQPAKSLAVGTGKDGAGQAGILGGVVEALQQARSVPPAGAKQLPRSTAAVFARGADTIPRLLTAVRPALKDALYTSWQNIPPAQTPGLEVYALRVEARPFGHNAPLRLTGIDDKTKAPQMAEWEINDPLNGGGAVDYHAPFLIYLDNEYEIPYPDPHDPVRSNTFIVIDRPQITFTRGAGGFDRFQRHLIVAELDLGKPPIHRSLSAYGLSGKTVQIALPEQPDDPNNPLAAEKRGGWLAERDFFYTVRNTRVFAGSELLELAEAPIGEVVAGCEIELDGLYDGLQPGRWLIVAGERSIKVDDKAVTGVKAAELVMIDEVKQGAPRTGDKTHTFITLAETCLAYKYKRDTVTIYGNVVEATHGETRREVLGNGDAAKTLQTFKLKQSPLTFVSAATVSGVDSTLEVRVNDVQWHEAESLAALGPKDRKFLTRTGDDAKTSVVFGDGERGVRLPTGVENVKTTYRSGIGKPGNVKAEQITMLGTRPLGVKEVTNPIRASGGADRESRDQARQNAPIALLALDRLVSVSDYADFSRTFAGIGKAAAWHDTDGQQQLVRVVIAGADDIPIDQSSDLYRNLYAALHRFGDPYLPIAVAVRERLTLVISANVKIDPDYQWETLEPKIRTALLDCFSFARMELGGHVFLSDAIDAIQAVRGVVYVDIDVFAAIDEQTLSDGFTQQTALDFGRSDRIPVDRGQIAYLVAEVPDTLILQEIES
jgi:Baseplate J-like protein